MPDVHSKDIRSYNMSRIRSRGTKVELLLAKHLWAIGLRYRKNDKTVLGKPDFVFKKVKLAVFCDSEFWHGKDVVGIKKRITTNNDYWAAKIERNIHRDSKVNSDLSSKGWTVLRYWEKDIKKNPLQIAEQIKNVLERLTT